MADETPEVPAGEPGDGEAGGKQLLSRARTGSAQLLRRAARDAQLAQLQRWTERNCAAGIAFREDDCVVWLGSRERPRTKATSDSINVANLIP